MKFKNDMGRSMMEMILYLGLIVVLTTSTIKMYSDSVEKTRIMKLETQIDDLREYANTYYLGRDFPGPNGNWNEFKEAVGGATKFDNPWGGKMDIGSKAVDNQANSIFSKPSFYLQYKGSTMDIPRCVSVANTFITKGAFAVNVNSKMLSGNTLTISQIADNCTKDRDNTIEGYFYKE